MFYLVLERDLEKISLARKYVLSDRDLAQAEDTIRSIACVALDRIDSLESGSENRVYPLRADPF